MDELNRMAASRHMDILKEGERYHLLCSISGDVLYENLSTKQLSGVLLKPDFNRRETRAK